MFFVIVIAIIVLVVLFKLGVFKKAAKCKHCGKELKGIEQMQFGKQNPFILCKECAKKIHPLIKDYAKTGWDYSDFTDYLEWDESMAKEKKCFFAAVEYGSYSALAVDTMHGLFALGKDSRNMMVFKFSDLINYEIAFEPGEAKETFLGNAKVKGEEYIMIGMRRPNVYVKEILSPYATWKVIDESGLFQAQFSKYRIKIPPEYLTIKRAFESAYLCAYYNGGNNDDGDYSHEIDEIQKALALFMFDSLDEVTEENLKTQRNKLIKTFHPDKGEEDETYAKKINAAYDLLAEYAKKKSRK